MDIFGLAGNLLTTGINNVAANYRTQEDRKQNYLYNEMAARNADKRTRALYSDFYSPEALKRQYEEAGLSPSLMFGGTPGQGGTSGAQGAGSAGLQTPYMPLSMLEAAQISKTQAETKNIEAETKNINADTTIKEFESQLKEIDTENKSIEWKILSSTWENSKTGEALSLFEMADRHYTFNSFLEDVRKYGENNENIDPTVYKETQSEAGIKVLRQIYEASSRFRKDIMELSKETVNAKFELDIVSALQNENYPKMNAEAAVKELKASINTNELDSRQTQAWLNLLDRLGKKGSTWEDIAIVLGMIVQNFAGKVGVQIKTGL